VRERKDLVARIKAEHSPFISPEQYQSEASPIEPAALVRVLQQCLPRDSMVFVDAGNCVGWAAHYFAVDPPQEIHSCLSMGPMGFAVGAVVGAKLGAPAKTCLALVGDGAFLMHGAEVSTASRYRVGAIWVVLYDDDLHMVSQGQEHFFPDARDPGIWSELYALGGPDLLKVAQGLGADAYAVHRPGELEGLMPTVLARANSSGRPQVIVAHIDRTSCPPYYNPQY
jgi:acetolactate synthase-1/2/3 large subunit